MEKIRHDDENLYIVYVYHEVPTLENVLLALATYKRECGERWPREVCVREGNRLSFGLGSDIRLRYVDWMLIDALYMSLHDPWPDKHDNAGRWPVTLDCERVPVGERKWRKRSNG